MPAPTLSDSDAAILATVKRTWSWKYGFREAEIRRVHGLTMTQFWQSVGQLVLTEAAISYDPATCYLAQRRMRRPGRAASSPELGV